MKLRRGKKSGLAYFDIKNIESWNPCYAPTKHLSKDFRGTALDILKNESIPSQDRLWVVLRSQITSERVMRLFAVWAFRQILILNIKIDERSINAVKVAERYALGKATTRELKAAYATAAATRADSASTYANFAPYANLATYAAPIATYAAATSATYATTVTSSDVSGSDVSASYAATTAYAASDAAYAAASHVSHSAASHAAIFAEKAHIVKLQEMIIEEGRLYIKNKKGKK